MGRRGQALEEGKPRPIRVMSASATSAGPESLRKWAPGGQAERLELPVQVVGAGREPGSQEAAAQEEEDPC